MSGFYNYDTRGASFADQIINLERMVEERDAKIEQLREVLMEIAETAQAANDDPRFCEFAYLRVKEALGDES